jgi:hypothetical protein
MVQLGYNLTVMVAARTIKKKIFWTAAAWKMNNFATELPYISMDYVT